MVVERFVKNQNYTEKYSFLTKMIMLA